MQFAGARKRDLEAAMKLAEADVPAARLIPFTAHLTPGILKLRNGDLCASWRLHGIPFETASVEEIAAAKSQLVNFLHSVRSSDQGEPTAIWTHRVRRLARDRLKATFPSKFATDLDRKYWEQLGGRPMLRNELYITLVLRPTHNAAGALRKLRTRSAESLMAFDAAACKRLETLCTQVTGSLRRFGGERLTCSEKKTAAGVVVVSPMLSFFNFLLTGTMEDMPLQQGRVADYLCSARLFIGESTGVVEVHQAATKKFVGFVDLQEFPEVTQPGLCNCLLGEKFEFVETQSFSFLSKRESVDFLELSRRRLISSGEGSPEQIEDLGNAVEDVRNGRVFVGEHHYTLGVWGSSFNEVTKNMALARSTLAETGGFKVATVDLVPDAALFAQLPGNWKWRPRVGQPTTRNFASMAPLHNFDMGKRDGNPWGQCITLLPTPSGHPYYFNWHESPIGEKSGGLKLAGNTFICGMTGAGKSALMGFLLSQTTKVPGLRVLFFDKDRGAEIMIRALGGRYRQLRRGSPTGFNPFQWEPTRRNIEFVKRLVFDCARRGDEVLAVKLENALATATERVFALPQREHRRISALLQFLGEDSDAGERLAKWCRTPRKTGANAWVFDNATDGMSFEGANIHGFDYTDFLDDKECGPLILGYILEAADTMLNGEPFMFVMEEFAKAVQAPSQTLVEFGRDKQTTVRKLNGFGVFVTQSPSQVNDHPVGATLREQCVTQIYLPNERADFDDYVGGFKLSPTEFEAIQRLRKESRCFLIKQGWRSAVCSLDLSGMPDELEVISGTMDNVLLLDALRAELGSEDPDVWLPVFLDQLRAARAQARK